LAVDRDKKDDVGLLKALGTGGREIMVGAKTRESSFFTMKEESRLREGQTPLQRLVEIFKHLISGSETEERTTPVS